ncbi:hypothetical protein CC80DRAFT_369541, partial [Byssothecium circinans]
TARRSALQTRADLSKPINMRDVKVIVGAEGNRKVFTIPKNLICSRSEFFKRAFNGNWNNTISGTVCLDAEDPWVFTVYHKLLFRAGIQPRDCIDPGGDAKAMTQSNLMAEAYTTLCKLFVLAESLVDARTKCIVLRKLEVLTRTPGKHGQLHYPGMDCVQIIYDGTLPSSLARTLLVTLYSKHGNETFLDEHIDEVPKEFLYDLSRSMIRDRPRKKDVDAKIATIEANLRELR